MVTDENSSYQWAAVGHGSNRHKESGSNFLTEREAQRIVENIYMKYQRDKSREQSLSSRILTTNQTSNIIMPAKEQCEKGKRGKMKENE